MQNPRTELDFEKQKNIQAENFTQIPRHTHIYEEAIGLPDRCSFYFDQPDRGRIFTPPHQIMPSSLSIHQPTLRQNVHK